MKAGQYWLRERTWGCVRTGLGQHRGILRITDAKAVAFNHSDFILTLLALPGASISVTVDTDVAQKIVKVLTQTMAQGAK